MFLRRAVSPLLARRFQGRALSTPWDLALGDGLRGAAAGVAAAALFGGATFAYFKKHTVDDDDDDDDESAFKKKVPPACNNKFIIDEEEVAARHDSEKQQDIKARFEDWMKKYGKTYRDEEEKAMRFQLFKNTVEWFDSQPPSARKKMEINYFADLTEKEVPSRQPGVDLYSQEYHDYIKELRAKQAKGESLVG